MSQVMTSACSSMEGWRSIQCSICILGWRMTMHTRYQSFGPLRGIAGGIRVGWTVQGPLSFRISEAACGARALVYSSRTRSIIRTLPPFCNKLSKDSGSFRYQISNEQSERGPEPPIASVYMANGAMLGAP